MQVPKQVFKNALEMKERDRATLASLLIESLETELEGDIESKWLEEVDRRIAELDAGASVTVPWSDVKKRLLRGLDEVKGS